VEPPKPRQRRRRHPEKKPTQRRGIGISRQPGQILKDAVVLEQIERLDPPQSENDGIEKSENFFGDPVAIVPLRKPKMTIEQDTEIDFVNESLEEGQTTEMSQTPPRKFDF